LKLFETNIKFLVDFYLLKAAYNVNIFAEYVNLMLGYRLDNEDLNKKQRNPRFNCMGMKIFVDRKRPKIDRVSVDIIKLRNSDQVVEYTLYKNVGDVCSDAYFYAWMTVKAEFKDNLSLKNLIQLWHNSSEFVQVDFA
jgi:hypothetical protein